MLASPPYSPNAAAFMYVPCLYRPLADTLLLVQACMEHLEERKEEANFQRPNTKRLATIALFNINKGCLIRVLYLTRL